MSVLVLGAAGFLGLHAVDACRAAGLEVVAGRRPRTAVLPLRSRKVPMTVADLDDPVGLAAAMNGHDVVVHAAGHYPRHSLHPAQSLQTGLRQTSVALDAAAAAGVRRLVYVSSTATVAPRAGATADESSVFPRAPGWGTYHDLKWGLEDLVRRERRFETVILCPAGCLGPEDYRMGTSALLVAVARGLDPVHPDGWVDGVDVRDVGRAIARACLDPSPPERVILAGFGARLHPLLEQLADRYGVARPRRPSTPEDARAYADSEERRAEAGGPRARLSREIVDLVVHGHPVDASRARAWGLTFLPLSKTLDDFDTWARRARLLPALEAPCP